MIKVFVPRPSMTVALLCNTMPFLYVSGDFTFDDFFVVKNKECQCIKITFCLLDNVSQK